KFDRRLRNFHVKTSRLTLEHSSTQSYSKAQSKSRLKAHTSVASVSGAIKRGMDVGGAIAGLVGLSPLMALIALLVKATDGGPIFYSQTRLGLNRRTFRSDADDHREPVWSMPHDPRCTLVGSWLRRLGLDELPQLWNILRGEMSFVGPRPERPKFVKEFRNELPDYDHRHSVPCGLTGYAQVHGWRGYTGV